MIHKCKRCENIMYSQKVTRQETTCQEVGGKKVYECEEIEHFHCPLCNYVAPFSNGRKPY